MKFIFILISLFILSACSEKKVPEKLSRQCELKFAIFGGPQQDACAAYFNIGSYTKDTLFVSQSKYNDGKKDYTIKHINLKPLEIDTLYSYFQQIKENFKLEAHDDTVLDGTRVSITIANDGNSVTFIYTGLENAGSADPQIDKLIKFINTRLPKDFQMY